MTENMKQELSEEKACSTIEIISSKINAVLKIILFGLISVKKVINSDLKLNEQQLL